MLIPELMLRFPAIWNIQTSSAVPEMVIDEGMVTEFVHL